MKNNVPRAPPEKRKPADGLAQLVSGYPMKNVRRVLLYTVSGDCQEAFTEIYKKTNADREHNPLIPQGGLYDLH